MARTGNPNWKAGGPSPNPSGRKKGSKNKKTLILQELEKDGSALALAIKAKALEGDPTCLSLWLSRLEPPARTRGETVEFAFDAKKPLAEQLEAIVHAVADGELTLEQAKVFVEMIEKLANVRRAETGGTSEQALIDLFKDLGTKVPV
jgi:hypothetical protein